MKQLWPYLRLTWVPGVLVVLLSLAMATAMFVNPWVSRLVYEDLVKTFDPLQTNAVLFVMVFLVLGVTLLEMTRHLVSVHIKTKIIAKLRMEIFDDLLHYPFPFVNKEDNGGIVQRVMAEVELLADLVSKMGVIVSSIAQLGIVYALLAMMNIKVFALVVSLTAINLLWNMLWKQPLTFLNKRIGLGSGDLYSNIQHFFQAIKQIKCYNTYDHYLSVFENSLYALKGRMVRRDVIASLLKQGAFIQMNFGAIMLITLVFLGVKDGSISLGEYVFYGMLVGFTSMPILQIAQFFASWQMGIVALGRMKEIKGLDREKSGDVGFSELNDNIIFQDTHFAYEKENWVLNGLNLCIVAGKHTAIVGHSGSGKSTLVNLLLGLYPIKKGYIRFDWTPLEDLNISQLRSNIGYIPQWTLLFEGSLRDNIDVNNTFSDEEIIVACKQAKVDDLITKNPEGLNYYVSENGGNLSGGERQRISLARALLKQPKILLLDEPTSAVDPETEQHILANLQRLQEENKGLTIISISHNLNLVRKADGVAVMQNGVVIEEGHPSNLEDNGTAFRELFQINSQPLQKEQQEDPNE